MKTVNYSTAREKLVEFMKAVCETNEPLLITRRGAPSVVMLSLDDFNSIQETLYLVNNPKNAMHLFKSIQQFENGETEEHGLIDE